MIFVMSSKKSVAPPPEDAGRARVIRQRVLKVVIIAAIALTFIFGMLVALNKPGSGEFEMIDLSGIHQEGITLGDPNAPWTLIEFADPQCPFCHDHIGEALPKTVDEMVRNGELKIRLQLMDFLGDDSAKAALFALAASEQNKFWPTIEELYSHQGEENSGWVTPELLREISAKVGLDESKMTESSATAQAALNTSKAQAGELGVSSVPSFFLEYEDGDPTPLNPDGLDPESFVRSLREAGVGGTPPPEQGD